MHTSRLSSLNQVLAYLALVHPFAVSMVLLTTTALAFLAAEGLPAPGSLLRLVGVVALSQACVGITNELHDLPIDRRSKPNKPLVSGAARPEVARLLAIASGAGSLLLGLTFGMLGLLLAALGTLAGLAYNYWFKGSAFSWLPYAAGFSVLLLWPFAALGRWVPALSYGWLPVLPASIALNLAQSLADIESDTLHGVRGLAQRLGSRAAPAVMGLAALLAVALALLIGLNGPRALPLLVTACACTLLVAAGVARCYLRPGTAARLLAWRLVALGLALLGIGWLAAVL